MGILKSVGDFLFGKDPDIFNAKGEVQHKMPEQKWEAWNKRFNQNPDFDWRQHSGKAPHSARTSKDTTRRS